MYDTDMFLRYWYRYYDIIELNGKSSDLTDEI